MERRRQNLGGEKRDGQKKERGTDGKDGGRKGALRRGGDEKERETERKGVGVNSGSKI